MSDAQLSDELTRVHAEEQSLAARRLVLVREIDGRDMARREGASTMVAWLRDRLRISVGAAKRWLELARGLDFHAPATAEALAEGVVNEEQAAVIVRCLATIGEVSQQDREKAEARLIDDAAAFEPLSLAKLGSRILEHVAPELAEAKLGKQLAEAEERARRERTFTLSPDGTGRVRLTGWLESDAAAIVTAALDPLTAPVPADDRTPGQRRADALVEACRLVLACGELPDNGGERPQLVVTMDFDRLAASAGAGMLDNGQWLTAATVRRLACDAAIIPAVLRGGSQVLDVGRERRLFTGPLRRALVLRDGGCAFPGCDRPPRWGDGHHIEHWSAGGATCLDNAVLLCGFHHRLVHHGGWQVRMAADRLPEFVPPAWIDPAQVPRRNTYHRRT